MPEISSPCDFEPNAAARSIWLKTRKAPFTCGNVSLPGFYQTVRYNEDFTWVVMALMIEVVAFFGTIYGGFLIGGNIFLISAIGAILFIVLDVVGAIWYHDDSSKRLLLQNRLLLEPQNADPIWEELRKVSTKRVFGFAFLILSAILKMLAVVVLVSIVNVVIAIVLAIFYCIVIYIHSNHTGFWLAEKKAKSSFKQQYKEWSSDSLQIPPPIPIRHAAETRIDTISIPVQLQLPIIVIDGLQVPKITHRCNSISYKNQINNGAIQEYSYNLETIGIITDNDIIAFCGSVPGANQKGILAIELLRHQLNRIHH